MAEDDVDSLFETVAVADEAPATADEVPQPSFLERARGFVNRLFPPGPASESDVVTEAGSTVPEPMGEAVGEEEEEADPLSSVVEDVAEGPTPEQKATALGRGLATGAIRSAGVTQGAIAGGVAGAATPVPGGWIIGTILGGIGGYVLSDQAVDLLADPGVVGDAPITFRRLEDVPPKLRPYAVYGETFGSFVGPTGGIVGLGKAGLRVIVNPAAGRLKTFAGKWIDNVLQTAGTQTRRFTAAEAAGASTAALGGAAAEAVLPGDVSARLGAEVIGGIFSPVRLFLGLGHDVMNSVVHAGRKFGPEARLSRAGTILQEYIEAHGGDPARMAAYLQAATLPSGAKPTVAQVLGDAVASQFEAEFRMMHLAFGTMAEVQARQTLDATAAAIALLREVGSPEALLEAARLQNQAFKKLIELRLSRATEDARMAANEILRGTSLTADSILVGDYPQSAAARVSKAAAEILEAAMTEGRDAEKALYSSVPDVPRLPNNLVKQYGLVRSEMLRLDVLNPVLEGTIANIQKYMSIFKQMQKQGFDPVALAQMGARRANEVLERFGLTHADLKDGLDLLSTSGLKKFRSSALQIARKADAAFDDNLARRAGLLAEAALKDIDAAYRSAVKTGEIDRTAGEAYARARAFSYQFHETFTRAFGGVTQELGRRGQLQVPPEVLLRRAMASGPEMRALRFRELEEATRFLPKMAEEGFAVSEEAVQRAMRNGQVMHDALEQFIRLAAYEVVDRTGRVNADALDTFMQRNAALLDRFEPVRQVLRNALQSEDAAKLVEGWAKSEQAGAANTVFGRLLSVESPAVAIGRTLSSDTPLQGMAELVEMARTSPRPVEAMKGLRAAVWDWAFSKAQRGPGDPRVSIPQLIEVMDMPLQPGLPSLIDIGLQQGWMSAQDASTIRRLFDLARSVMRAQATLPTGELQLERVEDVAGAGADLLARVIGSKLGRMAQQALPGQAGAGESILAAGAGSRFVRQFMLRVPEIRVTQILHGALRGDPLPGSTQPYSLAIALLEAPRTAKHALLLTQQLHAYALGSTLTAVNQGLDQDPPDEDPLADAVR